MTKYFILALSLTVMTFVACNKPAKPSAASHMDWLRNGKWKVSSGTLTVKLPNGHDTVLNYMDWIPTCHLDDYFVFNSATTGAVFNGGITCDPSEADSISFAWKLTNSDKYLSLYNSDHLYYSVSEYIDPYVFDTLQWTPDLVLDTLYGVNDTDAGYTRQVIILDTIWNVQFNAVPVPNTDIQNAPITNFTENSFTIYFKLLAQYPDSTNKHAGLPDEYPITRPDTFKYSVTYTKY